MSNRPKGILAYGYDLGGSEKGWKVAEWNEDDRTINVQWISDEDSFSDLVETVLLTKLAKFTEVWETGAVDYYARRNEAEKSIKVELVRYGSWSYFGYILAIKDLAFESPDWGCKPIDLPLFQDKYTNDANREYLQEALDALGLHPHAPEPQWHLAAFYG